MSREITKLIRFYQRRLRNNQLCEVGQGRLKWWRENGKKFTSIRKALLTWKRSEIQAYLDDACLWWTVPVEVRRQKNTYKKELDYLTQLSDLVQVSPALQTIIMIVTNAGEQTDLHKWVADRRNRVV